MEEQCGLRNGSGWRCIKPANHPEDWCRAKRGQRWHRTIVWEENHWDTEGEHTCHIHPLGSPEIARFWCGHTCKDNLCRTYKVVWMLTHPLTVVRHVFGLDAQGRHR